VNTESINYHDLDHSSNNSAQIYIFRVWRQLCVYVHLERCSSESVTFKMNWRFYKLCPVSRLFQFAENVQCRQKELKLKCFLSVQIWIQILHKPWFILTQLWTTRPRFLNLNYQEWAVCFNSIDPAWKECGFYLVEQNVIEVLTT